VAQLFSLDLMRRRYKILILLIFLYAVTWIGGYYSHSATLRREAQFRYDGFKRDAVLAAVAAKGGPTSKVEWCFPLLPGVLIANSYYVLGPGFGQGGLKIVFYYGLGSWVQPIRVGYHDEV
jgi:hypothetical protein